MTNQYITLIGAEDVARAGHTISSAADQMQSAASNMHDIVYRQQQYLEEWIGRFEEAVDKLVKAQQSEVKPT